MRPIRAAMSSGEATTGRTSWPVMSFRSSSASTFDGSAIATSSAPSSSKPIGTALKRLAAWARDQVHRRQVGLVTPGGRRGRGRSARRWRAPAGRAVSAPDSSSTCSGVRPARRGPPRRPPRPARAARKPSSTITSEMKRAPPPRRCGGVSPVPSSWSGAGTRPRRAPSVPRRVAGEPRRRRCPRSSRVRDFLRERLLVDEALDQPRLAAPPTITTAGACEIADAAGDRAR